MTNPLLTIVIANYNYGRFLEEAIQSIVSQNMGDKVELIICDAASTDNSVEIIKKHADKIAWWCSEKDGGQSAAFNKGFSRASGEWLTWLNADDLLLPGTIEAFAALVARKPNAEWITGNKLAFDSDSRIIKQVYWGPHIQLPFISGQHAFSAVFGPTTFFKKSLYEKMGPIDEELHYAMDSAYWGLFTVRGVRQTRLNHICWGFRVHGASKTAGEQTKIITNRRNEETRYWRRKLKYHFPVRLSNVWYLAWVVWRIVDLSWVVRFIKKLKYEGISLDSYLKRRV